MLRHDFSLAPKICVGYKYCLRTVLAIWAVNRRSLANHVAVETRFVASTCMMLLLLKSDLSLANLAVVEQRFVIVLMLLQHDLSLANLAFVEQQFVIVLMLLQNDLSLANHAAGKHDLSLASDDAADCCFLLGGLFNLRCFTKKHINRSRWHACPESQQPSCQQLSLFGRRPFANESPFQRKSY